MLIGSHVDKGQKVERTCSVRMCVVEEEEVFIGFL
jgi:hypothetical protein